mmetsp:Transcript_45624/g.82381  ORF Transcript_45624/g.82381 Transcript_45624/m.82381 type:complete len:82 (+) Transcript_45624:1972-2217(+)
MRLDPQATEIARSSGGAWARPQTQVAAETYLALLQDPDIHQALAAMQSADSQHPQEAGEVAGSKARAASWEAPELRYLPPR